MWLRAQALGLLVGLACGPGGVQATQPPSPAGSPGTAAERPLLVLGPGDEVELRVFGQPDMNGVTYISDDGTLRVPLAGPVQISGMSPTEAARKVEAALTAGQYLVNPHVTLTVVKSQSQQVYVLGQVSRPGVYTVRSNTTVFELLAEAGGETQNGGDIVYILRPQPDGSSQRIAVDVQGISAPGTATAATDVTLRGGDQVVIPPAPQFYITGEVHSPAEYHLKPGMTVLQAISRAGGITPMGSARRVIIKRMAPGGRYQILSAKMSDEVHPDDVITVKERIF